MKSTAYNSSAHSVNPAILLAEQSAILLEKDQIIVKKKGVISIQKKRIAILEEALRLSKIKRFAPTSEKSEQGSLFDEAEVEVAQSSEEEPDEQESKTEKKKARLIPSTRK